MAFALSQLAFFFMFNESVHSLAFHIIRFYIVHRHETTKNHFSFLIRISIEWLFPFSISAWSASLSVGAIAKHANEPIREKPIRQMLVDCFYGNMYIEQ